MKYPRIYCTNIDWDTSDYGDNGDPCDANIPDLPKQYEIDEDTSLVKDTIETLEENGVKQDSPDFMDRFIEQIRDDEEGSSVISDYLSDMFGFCINSFQYRIAFVNG